MDPRRCVGVDWSGAAGRRAAARAIWLAIVRTAGWSRSRPDGAGPRPPTRLVELVVRRARDRDRSGFLLFGAVVVSRRARHARGGELWRWAAAGLARDAGFVRALGPPFWGPGIRPRPRAGGPPLRRTEERAPAPGRPAELVLSSSRDPAASARSHCTGMPELMSLCDVGVSVWPFDPPRFPLVVEVFPRALARRLAPAAERLRGSPSVARGRAGQAPAFGELRRPPRHPRTRLTPPLRRLRSGRAAIWPASSTARAPRRPTCARARSWSRRSAELYVVRLDIEYDGTRFSGWAEQPRRRTCEGVLRTPWG